MIKSVLSIIALCGFAVSAQAADLPVKVPPPPDTLTYAGFTVYGVVDVGYGYQNHGLGVSSSLYSGEMYNIVGNTLPATGPSRAGTTSALTENALSVSTIGLKFEKSIGLGWTAVGNIDTGFNPLSGEIADACKSLVQGVNAVLNKGPVSALGDGSRCGQTINGEYYAGLSNPAYGTVQVGRLLTIPTESLGAFDPQKSSIALSLFGWAGAAGAGGGSTETARWDNSIKYHYEYGPVHAAVMYTNGGDGTSLHGSGYAGSVGTTYKGFSVEGYYENEKGAVNLQGGNPLAGATNVNQMEYYLSNNETYGLLGKYVFDLGGSSKDNTASKLTVSGGYVRSDMNGAGPGIGLSAGTTIGGYMLTLEGLNFISTRTLETTFFGARYETGPWSFAAAWYRLTQNSFIEQNLSNGTGGCSVNAYACAGSTSMVTGLVDYAFNKYFDVYGAIAYSDDAGGLAHSSTSGAANGYTNNVTALSGIRVRF